MKSASWIPGGVHVSKSAKRDSLLIIGIYSINVLTFSTYLQLVHAPTKPWLLLAWLYGVAVLVPLVWRNRAPVAVFTAQCVFTVAVWPIQPYYTPVLGIPVALYAVAVHHSRKISLLAVLASFIPNGVAAAVAFRVYDNPAVALAGFIIMMITLPLVTTFAWGAGRLTRKVQFLESEREMAREAEVLATERTRIARELHDIVSHAVTVMVVQAGGAARIAETDARQVTQSLVHIETAGRQAMVELQRLLGVLNASDPPNHGAASGERGPQPGLVDLGALLDSLREVGLLVTVHTEGTPRELDPSVDLTAYRIAQEALTNILRHAGIDTNPHLRLTWQAQSLHIQVDNDTNPTKTHHERDLPGGHGLLGLHERARAVGGHLHAAPHQDGYRLTATLPLAAHRSTDTPRPQTQLPSPTLPFPVIR